MDKENRDKKEYESKIEEKGYKKGLSEGKILMKESEGIDNAESTIGNVSDMSNDSMFSPSDAEEELTRRMEEQQIPNEVLEELMMLAQNNPDMFKQVIEQYPQLAEMLQNDIKTMNGEQI